MNAQRQPAAQRHRILVMSHRHPDFSLGGGEIAAYNLFKAYREHGQVEDAWFLASADRHRGMTGAISPRRPGEFLWEQSIGDWFLMKAAHRESVATRFAELLRTLRPTVVHTHHYAHLGMEYLRVIKQVDPAIRIVMTLHEYLAICHHQGQMIKTNGQLCSRESLDDCRGCFPDRPQEAFWLRKQYIQGHLALVDQFVSPSEFLRQRYIAWGIPAEKIVVIENGQDDAEPLPPRPLAEGEGRNRFGFFGQVTPFKGLHVLLRALTDLPKEDRRKIVLEVHGANLDKQPEDYRHQVKALLDPLVQKGIVQWMGPYQPHELRQRMAGVDWVVVPSTWWENSPMVIQEAFVCGRPLLVSNIGGMAEKVRDGVDGLHVSVNNPKAWGAALLQATASDTWEQMRGGIKKPLSNQQVALAHLPHLEPM